MIFRFVLFQIILPTAIIMAPSMFLVAVFGVTPAVELLASGGFVLMSLSMFLQLGQDMDNINEKVIEPIFKNARQAVTVFMIISAISFSFVTASFFSIGTSQITVYIWHAAFSFSWFLICCIGCFLYYRCRVNDLAKQFRLG